jgi:membrane-associated protease RseP (regulator of RpoE activity)
VVASPRWRTLGVPVALFLACCVTTWWAAERGQAGSGWYFAPTVMGILLCHETGHYVVGRLRGVPMSLPHFIPLPPVFSIGTLGAVIGMDTITDRKKLFDVGAAGPIAGLVVAIPMLVIGLHLSEVKPIDPDGVIEGNSVFYALLKRAMFGEWLPGNGVDVQLHPMALAAWVGLLLTMINLIPIGQLDGGHVARAALGGSHEAWSRRFHFVLPAIGVVTGGVMLASALVAGRSIGGALSYALYGFSPWCVWALVLAWMRTRAGEYHPPVDDVPLDPRRRRMAIAMLVIFLLIATPVPFRPVL